MGMAVKMLAKEGHDTAAILTVSPVQTDSNDGRGRLPSTEIDSISCPICHPGPQSPGLVLGRDRVHVGVGPYSWGSKTTSILVSRRLDGRSVARS